MRGLTQRISLLVLFSSTVLGCQQQKQASEPSVPVRGAVADYVEVTLAKATRERISATLELTGNLFPRRRSVVVAEVDGVVAAMPRPRETIQLSPEQVTQLRSVGVDLDEQPLGLDMGDHVPEGGVLVQLHPRDFELELEAAKSRLNRTKSDLAKLLEWRRQEEIRRLQSGVDTAQARLERAKSELERVQSLRNRSAVSDSVFEERAMEARTAKGALEQVQAELDIALAGPTKAELAVAQAALKQAESEVAIAEQRLKKTVILSPYDAVVTDRFVDVGDRVTALPRVEIMEIADIRLVLAQVAVPERFAGLLRRGMPAVVRADGVETTADGLVVIINDKVDPETRTFRTRVAIDNRDGKFKAGQFVRVAFEIMSRGDSLVVPSKSLTFAGGQAQVFVYDSGRVSQRNIKTGIANETMTEILAGLTPGEPVVVDDPSILANDMKVQVRTDTRVATRAGSH